MTAKSSRPDRKRGDRRGGRREPSEFSEATLSIDRVTRVVKGGRRMRFRAIVIVGNKKGKVGLGTGKAAEVQAAIKKASASAKRNMFRVPIIKGTIPHQVELKFKAARVRLLPALPGTGIIAGGAVRVILDQAGVRDVLSKRYGTRNKLVNAQATMQALQMLRQVPGSMTTPEEAAAVAAGEAPKKTVTIEGLKETPDELRTGGVEIQQVSKKEAEAQKEIHRKGKMEE